MEEWDGIEKMENTLQWTRKELKNNAKNVLKRFYWRFVLLTAIMTLITTMGGYSYESIQTSIEDITGTNEDKTPVKVQVNGEDGKIEYENNSLWNSPKEALWKSAIFLTALFAFFTLLMLIFLCKVLLSTFLINPLNVGFQRCHLRGYEGKVQLKDFFFGVENNYKNVVRIMFLRDLYTILWFLLFLIPGIVKMYEYKMIPYLLAENPNMNMQDAFAISKKMTDGQKWKMFLLDLSFIGWHLLGLVTFGVAGVLFTKPYRELTIVGLYRRLRGMDVAPQNVYYDGMLR